MEQRIIDATALKVHISELMLVYAGCELTNAVLQAIDNAPTVEPKYFPPCEDCHKKMDDIRRAYDKMKKTPTPKGEWIPITMRPIEEEEKIDFPDDTTFIFDCLMPEDGQNILISTKYGVEFDTCFADDGYYLDSDRDWEDVYAWQPLPEPYKRGDENE